MAKICLDFDGVICESTGIPTSKFIWEDRKPVELALEAVNHLIKVGHTVWIMTSNPEFEEVKKWLKDNNFPDIEVTNIKKPAHVYIDDRALRFTNWQDIRRYFG